MLQHSTTTIDPGEVVANPRVVETVQPVIDAIREILRERQVAYDEWHAAVAYLMEVADTGEVPLLLDVLFEATVDEVANVQSSSSATAIQGPYYVPGAPLLERPYVMPQRPDEPGETLLFSGRVTSSNGSPLAGALLDVWHADANVPGTYSNVHPGQPDYNLRCRLLTDDDGRFELRTIKPAPYPIPDQGPTGRLLNSLGRHSWRPAHIHVKASAEGHKTLTTQIYFAGGEFLDSDSANAVKDELILPLAPGDDDRDAHFTLHSDLVLEPEA